MIAAALNGRPAVADPQPAILAFDVPHRPAEADPRLLPEAAAVGRAPDLALRSAKPAVQFILHLDAVEELPVFGRFGLRAPGVPAVTRGQDGAEAANQPAAGGRNEVQIVDEPLCAGIGRLPGDAAVGGEQEQARTVGVGAVLGIGATTCRPAVRRIHKIERQQRLAGDGLARPVTFHDGTGGRRRGGWGGRGRRGRGGGWGGRRPGGDGGGCGGSRGRQGVRGGLHINQMEPLVVAVLTVQIEVGAAGQAVHEAGIVQHELGDLPSLGVLLLHVWVAAAKRCGRRRRAARAVV